MQDTKSSNGTFVNNQRLSKGSEESPPREVLIILIITVILIITIVLIITIIVSVTLI